MLHWNILFKLVLVTLLLIRKIDCRTHVNVGTVLFDSIDCDKVCWTPSGELLLNARNLMQNMLPDELHPSFHKSYVSEFVDYVHSTLGIIRNTAHGEAQKALVLALSDVIGGYMRVYLIPMAKQKYYNGNFPYSDMNHLYTLYEDIKSLLRADGSGWSSPIPMENDLSKLPSLLVSKKNLTPDACARFIINKNNANNSNIIIPLPYLDDNRFPHSIAVPFRKHSLRSLQAKSSTNLLTKYYVSGMKCLLSTASEDDFKNFNEEVEIWLKRTVLPHLDDEEWYPAFGGVNRVFATVLRVRSVLRENFITNYDIPNLHGCSSSIDVASVKESIQRDLQKVTPVVGGKSCVLSPMNMQHLGNVNIRESCKSGNVNDNDISGRTSLMPSNNHELHTDSVNGLSQSLRDNQGDLFWKSRADTYSHIYPSRDIKSHIFPRRENEFLNKHEPVLLHSQNRPVNLHSVHSPALISAVPTFPRNKNSRFTEQKFQLRIQDRPLEANADNILQGNPLSPLLCSHHGPKSPNLHAYNDRNVERNLTKTYEGEKQTSVLNNRCSSVSLDSAPTQTIQNAAVNAQNYISAESAQNTLSSDGALYSNMKTLDKVHVSEPTVTNKKFNPRKESNYKKLQQLQENNSPVTLTIPVTLPNIQTTFESVPSAISLSVPETRYDYMLSKDLNKNMHHSALGKPSKYPVIQDLNSGRVSKIANVLPYASVEPDYTRSFATYVTSTPLIEPLSVNAIKINQPSSHFLKDSVILQRENDKKMSWSDLNILSKSYEAGHGAVSNRPAFVPVSDISVTKINPFVYIHKPISMVPFRNNYDSHAQTEMNHTGIVFKSNVFDSANVQSLYENKDAGKLLSDGRRDNLLLMHSLLQEHTNEIPRKTRTAKQRILDTVNNINRHPKMNTYPIDSNIYKRNPTKNEENKHHAIFHNHSPGFLSIKIDNEYPIVSNFHKKNENGYRGLSESAMNPSRDEKHSDSFIKGKFLKSSNVNHFQSDSQYQKVLKTNSPILALSSLFGKNYQHASHDIKYREVPHNLKIIGRSVDDDQFKNDVVDRVLNEVNLVTERIRKNPNNRVAIRKIRNDLVHREKVVHDEPSDVYNDRYLGKQTAGNRNEDTAQKVTVTGESVSGNLNEEKRLHKSNYDILDNKLNESSQQFGKLLTNDKQNANHNQESQHQKKHRAHTSENKKSLNLIKQYSNNQPNNNLQNPAKKGCEGSLEGFIKCNKLKTKAVSKNQRTGHKGSELHDKDEYKEEEDDEEYAVDNYKKSKGFDVVRSSRQKLNVRSGEQEEVTNQSGMCWFMFSVVKQGVCTLIVSPDLAITNFIISVLFWVLLWFSYCLLTWRCCPCIDFDEETCISYDQEDMKCIPLGEDYYVVQCGCGAQSFLKTTFEGNNLSGYNSAGEFSEGEPLTHKCVSQSSWKGNQSSATEKDKTEKETSPVDESLKNRKSKCCPSRAKSACSNASRSSFKSLRSTITIQNDKNENKKSANKHEDTQETLDKSEEGLLLRSATCQPSGYSEIVSCVGHASVQEQRRVDVGSTPTGTARITYPSRTTDTSRETSRSFDGDPTEPSDLAKESSRTDESTGHAQSERGSGKSHPLTKGAERDDVGGVKHIIPPTTLVCACGQDGDVVQQVEAALQVIRMASYVAESPEECAATIIEPLPLRNRLPVNPRSDPYQPGNRLCPQPSAGNVDNPKGIISRLLTVSSLRQDKTLKGSENSPISSRQMSRPPLRGSSRFDRRSYQFGECLRQDSEYGESFANKSVSKASDCRPKCVDHRNQFPCMERSGEQIRHNILHDLKSLEGKVRNDMFARDSIDKVNTAKRRDVNDDYSSGTSVSHLSDLIEDVREERLDANSSRTTISNRAVSPRSERTSHSSKAPTVRRRKTPY